MKKIGIITLTDNCNYGNRLQNYALSFILKKLNYNVSTIWIKKSLKFKFKVFIKNLVSIFIPKYKTYKFRNKKIFKIKRFTNKYIQNFYINKKNISRLETHFDKFIIGSDQIWNPNVVDKNQLSFLTFVDGNKKVAYAPSIGVSVVDEKFKKIIEKELTKKNFKYVSVREKAGQEILEKYTKRDDIQLLIDPTMLLTLDEWKKIEKKPKKLKSKKYILLYFLGCISNEIKNEINRIAIENKCEIIDIMDINNQFYTASIGEFLYLEKNAFLICTDSFHSCVFAFIYNKPFVVFERKDNSKEIMTSRIDNLIQIFNLKDRKYNGKNITQENLKNDYTDAYEILVREKQKSIEYLKKALNYKNGEKNEK